MSRIFQDSNGDLNILNGKTLEELFCVQARHHKTNHLQPAIFWLKVTEDDQWHRFFIDSLQACWESHPDVLEDDMADPEMYPVANLSQEHALTGKRISTVSIREATWNGQAATILQLTLEGGHQLIVRQNHDQSDLRISQSLF